MELKIREGDYVPDGMGGAERVEGREALLQRVLYRLTARRGAFPFLPELGSDLAALSREPASQRQSAAEKAVVQALADEEDLWVESVTLEGEELTARLRYEGEELAVRLEIR